MSDEVVEFANQIGAIDLKPELAHSKFYGLFKRPNYFLLDEDKFLIIEISRSKIRPLWGLGKQFFDFFNAFTEKSGNYFFVALVSNKSGWVLSKKEILSQISDGSLSYADNEAQYNIDNNNLKDKYSFTSTEGFFSKIAASR